MSIYHFCHNFICLFIYYYQYKNNFLSISLIKDLVRNGLTVSYCRYFPTLLFNYAHFWLHFPLFY